MFLTTQTATGSVTIEQTLEGYIFIDEGYTMTFSTYTEALAYALLPE